jgi:signal transduction histidine kinase
MSKEAVSGAADVIDQLLRNHQARRRMRRTVLLISLLLFYTVDVAYGTISHLLPIWLSLAVDGVFALLLGVSVLIAFDRYDTKQLVALHALVLEARERDQLVTRLTTVRETARALAHGMNQPLAVIRGYAELMQSAPPGEWNARDLVAIISATDRAAALVQDLLKVTRYVTDTAADGRPMLNVPASVEPATPLL